MKRTNPRFQLRSQVAKQFKFFGLWQIILTALVVPCTKPDVRQYNKGSIWLGTNNDGVYKQNGEKFDKFEPNKKG